MVIESTAKDGGTGTVTSPSIQAPVALFARARVTAGDERVFLCKVAVLTVLTGAGAALAVNGHLLVAAAGIVLVAAMYTHAVELQHQCLHHSAFRRALPHRVVGVMLGLPLLVVYSHYRLRHLQHHRYLGTPDDTEFFGFDTRRPLTAGHLLRSAFDYRRLVTVCADIGRCATGRWVYPFSDVKPAVRRHIVVEHLLLGTVLVGAAALAVTGRGDYMLRLWLLPLLLAVPLHFVIELPEHILCDTDTTEVLRNTRSIRGSWFSTWFTNGNNLHIEHHAAMAVPINHLPSRHHEVRRLAVHVERTYWDFCRRLWTAVRTGTHA